jgi:hypothetical protein
MDLKGRQAECQSLTAFLPPSQTVAYAPHVLAIKARPRVVGQWALRKKAQTKLRKIGWVVGLAIPVVQSRYNDFVCVVVGGILWMFQIAKYK